MSESTIYVFEQRPRWRPELQRAFVRESVVVRASGSLQELKIQSKSARSLSQKAVWVLDLGCSLSDTLQFLSWSQTECMRGNAIVVGAVEHSILEPTLRELGAISFHQYPLQRERLADECRKLLGIA